MCPNVAWRLSNASILVTYTSCRRSFSSCCSHVCLDSCPSVTWCSIASIAVPARYACIIWLCTCVTVRSGAASSMLMPSHSTSWVWYVLYLWAHFGAIDRVHSIGHVTFVQGFCLYPSQSMQIVHQRSRRRSNHDIHEIQRSSSSVLPLAVDNL